MKLMLVNFNDRFLIQVAKQLRQKDVDLAFLIGLRINKADFKDTQIMDYMDLMRPGYYEGANAQSPYALSESIIREFSECGEVFISNSDRLSFFNTSVRERKIVYYNILLHWYTFFRANKIDLIIFESTPHMGWDIVLYFVARKFGIKTFYLERTLMNDVVFFVEDYAKMKKVPRDYLPGKTEEEISKSLSGDLYESVFKKCYWKEPLGRPPQPKKRFLRTIKNSLKSIPALAKADWPIEKREPSVFSLNKPISRIFLSILKELKRSHDKKLRGYYIRLSEKVNAEDRYVFFPLQFQPERTSIPLGSVYENQLLALYTLSKSIPGDWKIYVKEHPRQLKHPRINCVHYRNRKYYDRIKSVPKAVLIDSGADTKKLIKKAEFTATLTGSSGWESIVAGKACIVFGYPWYLGCNSCYRVNSVETAKQAILQIINKTPSDVHLDMAKFLSYYKGEFIVSTNSDFYATQSDKDYDHLVKNLADAIISKAGC